MSITGMTPYLHFNGTAERAIQLYQKALGAKTEGLMRWEDGPGGNVAPEHKKRVMHAHLTLGPGGVMVADSLPDDPAPTEGNVQVCLAFDDADDMARKFDALAVGGKVTMPLQDTFWGAKFGTLTDAYGIKWMFNCEHKK